MKFSIILFLWEFLIWNLSTTQGSRPPSPVLSQITCVNIFLLYILAVEVIREGISESTYWKEYRLHVHTVCYSAIRTLWPKIVKQLTGQQEERKVWLTYGLLVPYWEQALCSHKLPGFLVIPHTQSKASLSVWLRTSATYQKLGALAEARSLGCNDLVALITLVPLKWGSAVYSVSLSTPQNSGFL